MNAFGLLVGLTRLRLLLTICGLAFLAGVQIPLGTRLLLAALALVAVALDAYLEVPHIRPTSKTIPTQRINT